MFYPFPTYIFLFHLLLLLHTLFKFQTSTSGFYLGWSPHQGPAAQCAEARWAEVGEGSIAAAVVVVGHRCWPGSTWKNHWMPPGYEDIKMWGYEDMRICHAPAGPPRLPCWPPRWPRARYRSGCWWTAYSGPSSWLFITFSARFLLSQINQKSVNIYHQNLIPKILSLCLILATKAIYYLW